MVRRRGSSEAGSSCVVSDDGEGIPAEALEKVFEPFWRGEQARTSKGSGLGLTLVKRIVEGLGGEVRSARSRRRGRRLRSSVPAG